VEAMVRLMACPAAGGEIVHIGDDTEETNIADLAKLVLRATGTHATLEPSAAPAGSVARRCPDLDKLRALTGYQPSVALEDGVRRTVEWYRGWGGR
jgi:UDP-glucuronate decarboxylase